MDSGFLAYLFVVTLAFYANRCNNGLARYRHILYIYDVDVQIIFQVSLSWSNKEM